jgi:hypothetical protein
MLALQLQGFHNQLRLLCSRHFLLLQTVIFLHQYALAV